VNEAVDVSGGGVLYPPGLPAVDLADLLARTLEDAEGMAARRQACRTLIEERFSTAVMVRSIVKLYEDAPASSLGIIPSLKTRWRLSPLRWKTYVKHRWEPGCEQYKASEDLWRSGEQVLATAALRASMASSPTIFLRRRRLVHGLRVLKGASTRRDEAVVGPATESQLEAK
jgi:hypothetical protein